VGEVALQLGCSVAMDGGLMVVGAQESDARQKKNAGVANMYRLDSMGIWQFEAQLVASDPQVYAFMGSSVSISGDTAIAGASETYNTAYIFVCTDGKWSQQQKLTPSDGAAGDKFGHSVAIYGDIAVVGSPYDDDGGADTGSVYVFARSDSTWSLLQKLTASDAASKRFFGKSVSISGDTLLVGASGGGSENTEAGSVYVFTSAGGLWTQRQILTPSDAAPGCLFGDSVSIAGNTAVAGAKGSDGTSRGAAYVFVRGEGGLWTQEQKLTSADAAVGAYFGCSVSVAQDAILIGAKNDRAGTTSNCGTACLFMRVDGVWTRQQVLTAENPSIYDAFGTSVCIYGGTVAIGAAFDMNGNTGKGSASVFSLSEDTWIQKQKLVPFEAAGQNKMGCAVALSGDTALIGLQGDANDEGYNSGSACVFVLSDGIWTARQKITPKNAKVEAFFGCSISVSGDTVVIGAYHDTCLGTDNGSAYVFRCQEDEWIEQQRLQASSPKTFDQLGFSVAISGDTVITGANGRDNMTGAAFVFVRSGDTWSEQQSLSASDGRQMDQFGYSVSIFGDVAVVGAPGDDDAGNESGSAYVFERSGGVWSQRQKLVPADAAAWDVFGSAVSLYGTTALIGAAGDDDAGANSGSVYVYECAEGVWAQRQKLMASEVVASGGFGSSISLSEDWAVVGAPMTNTAGTGLVYVFRRSGDSWTLYEKLAASDGAAYDTFGFSVAVDGSRVLTGAPNKNDPETASGAGYVYRLPLVNAQGLGWLLR